MKKKKTLLIVVIILVILLVLAGGAFAYLYFGTDLLKSDKELFAKYFMQLGDEEKGMFTKTFEDYANKKATSAYAVDGSFSVITNMPASSTNNLENAMMQELVEYGNSTNITYSGNVDNINKKAEQNFSINYNNSVNLPFKYKQVGDLYGVQADFLSPSYISIENNNLPDLFQKLGLSDVTGIPYKLETQELESLKFTDEELKHIQSNYILPIFNNLSEDKFSKVENEDGSISYVLNATTKDARDILVNMIQTLSTDNTMLNKINSIFSEVYGTTEIALTAEDLQDAANSLSSATVEEYSFSLIVTQKDGVTNSVKFDTNYFTVELLTQKDNSNAIYTINFNVQNILQYSIKMSYSGLNTNNVIEAIDVNIYSENILDTTISIKSTCNFDNAVNIEDFDTNTIVLNDYTEEQIQPFLSQVGTYIAEENSKQMTQIGFPQELGNPMIMWIMGPVFSITSVRQDITTDMDNAPFPPNPIAPQGDISSMFSAADDFIS